MSELAATTLRWEATGWDDPRVAALREEMDLEIRPRYAAAHADGASYPPPPEPDEILVAWVGLVDDAPAATASLRRLDVPGEPLRHEVKRVFIGAAHRRRGLAAQVLALVESSARAAGVTELVLQTGDRQPEAEALYVREGWHPVPAYPPYDALTHSRCYAKTL